MRSNIIAAAFAEIGRDQVRRLRRGELGAGEVEWGLDCGDAAV